MDSGENNILPIADFSFTTDYLTARFTDNSKDLDGTIDAYLWEFGDGGTSVSASPVHIYAIEGRYNVRLTVTDNSGGKSVKTAQVTVLNSSSGGGGDNIPPIVDFTFVQYNYTVTFTSNASDTDGAVVDYLWEFGDGKTSSMRDISYTYFAPGIYNVKLTVTDNWGATAVKEASVIIKGTSPGEGGGTVEKCPAVADFIVTPNYLRTTFSNATSGCVASVKWDFGDGETSVTPGSIYHNYKLSGKYTTKLTIVDGLGNTTTKTINVAVSDKYQNITNLVVSSNLSNSKGIFIGKGTVMPDTVITPRASDKGPHWLAKEVLYAVHDNDVFKEVLFTTASGSLVRARITSIDQAGDDYVLLMIYGTAPAVVINNPDGSQTVTVTSEIGYSGDHVLLNTDTGKVYNLLPIKKIHPPQLLL